MVDSRCGVDESVGVLTAWLERFRHDTTDMRLLVSTCLSFGTGRSSSYSTGLILGARGVFASHNNASSLGWFALLCASELWGLAWTFSKLFGLMGGQHTLVHAWFTLFVGVRGSLLIKRALVTILGA